MAAGTPILIAFGSNLDPLRNLTQGLIRLHRELPLARISTIYRTRPLAPPPGEDPASRSEEPDFLNGVAISHRDMDPLQLKKRLRHIESRQNRLRSGPRWAPRTLDLDIALMGGMVCDREGLTIPDPDILRRPFLALPLAELAPELRHPLQGQSLRELAAAFGPDPPGMRRTPRPPPCCRPFRPLIAAVLIRDRPDGQARSVPNTWMVRRASWCMRGIRAMGRPASRVRARTAKL
ncbi:MAG: 2-amino-4-hydroxy-6-hydroxymethyldihydropteridine diphosphokinase [Magnetococcales bacterium]|nr:2-amino-4-hydroxy-6-hydroxymethyldihydropteridine diphosphokinase [Magnetococcales bacterium]